MLLIVRIVLLVVRRLLVTTSVLIQGIAIAYGIFLLFEPELALLVGL